MRKETQEKLITLPIKLEHNIYRTVYAVYIAMVTVAIIAAACIFIAGLCWFSLN